MTYAWEEHMRIIVDGTPIPFEDDDSILMAMMRAGIHPQSGGCLCFGGDCPHCTAVVEGIAYVRTCQVPAKPGLNILSHPKHGEPEIPNDRPAAAVAARNLHKDVVVIGASTAGKHAAEIAKRSGKDTLLLDAEQGEEVIGIYPGPMVVCRTSDGMLHIHVREEIVVATGAAEIQPVVPGAGLTGLFTARAARKLSQAGINLGHNVSVGDPPASVETKAVSGTLVRFEGEKRVRAVVVRDENGEEHRYPCDTVSLRLGSHPRDSLLRMGHDMPVRAVGAAANESDIPPYPEKGTICPCAGVTVEDLNLVWENGFHEMELVKRATLAGTGTCQGSVCLPYLRSFLADRGEELQPAFTARPVTRQLTVGEIAAGAHHHPSPRTSLDAEHRKLGAQMDRVGNWWRPWRYGRVEEEYWAVREAVSIGDVSTLGKMIISGPDALELLEQLYPTRVATLKPGRSRYVLLLNERGYVMDDGLICPESDTRYTLTFTTGGSSLAEMWVRDWAARWRLNVHILNQTMSLGAINVTGPLAGELMKRAGLDNDLKYMRHTRATIADTPCHVFRLSFTGELSYELHHAADHSVKLWRTLLSLGRDLGIKPHGIEALMKLRLEKGHILVGQDTDFDSTPRRIHHEWAVKLDKPAFIGRQAVLRTNKIPLDKQLVGLEMPGEAPSEGAGIWHEGQYAGHVTSSTWSPVLGKSVMLGWLYLFDGVLPNTVTIDNRPAQRANLPFYDKDGTRARA